MIDDPPMMPKPEAMRFERELAATLAAALVLVGLVLQHLPAESGGRENRRRSSNPPRRPRRCCPRHQEGDSATRAESNGRNLARLTNDGRLQPSLARDLDRRCGQPINQRQPSRRCEVPRWIGVDCRHRGQCGKGDAAGDDGPCLRRRREHLRGGRSPDRHPASAALRHSPRIARVAFQNRERRWSARALSGRQPAITYGDAGERRYYLGKPTIGRIVVSNYPSVRAAWADMLRGQLDMLYEVGADAIDSLVPSSKIATFTFVRRYQYAVVLNNQSEPFRSKAFRQAVNYAIDRDAIIKDGMGGHGVASAGPVWLYHYAFKPGLAQSPLRRQARYPTAVRHASGRRPVIASKCLCGGTPAIRTYRADFR